MAIRPGKRLLAPVALFAAALLAWQAGAAAASHRVISRSQAHAVAVAITLRHSDLSGLKQVGSTHNEPSGAGNQASKCAGGVPSRLAFADVSSPDFENRSGQAPADISSETEVFPSAGLVAEDLGAARSARGQACIRDAIQASLRSQASKNETFTASVSLRNPPVSGADTAVEVRVAIVAHVTSNGKSVSVPITGDFIGFGWGQAEVTLSLLTTLTAPTASLERTLSAVLVSRARAAIG